MNINKLIALLQKYSDSIGTGIDEVIIALSDHSNNQVLVILNKENDSHYEIDLTKE